MEVLAANQLVRNLVPWKPALLAGAATAAWNPDDLTEGGAETTGAGVGAAAAGFATAAVGFGSVLLFKIIVKRNKMGLVYVQSLVENIAYPLGASSTTRLSMKLCLL